MINAYEQVIKKMLLMNLKILKIVDSNGSESQWCLVLFFFSIIQYMTLEVQDYYLGVDNPLR